MKLKNYFFYAAFLALSASGISQTIFSENFNGGNSFQNWTLINADNRVPAAAVAFVNDAWVITPDSTNGDSAAISTSWYSPAGAADDYMITPMINLNAGSVLSFQAYAPDASYPDGYEVRISNTTPTVAGLLANPALLTVSAENSVWTDRNIDLSSYGTDSVYIAWRNVSNDMYVLIVDNIKVYTPLSEDVELTSLNVNNVYTTGQTVSIAGQLTNNGGNILTSVKLNWSIDGGVTVNTDSLPLNLTSFASAPFASSVSLTAASPGNYTDLMVWLSEPNGTVDLNSMNDTVVTRFFVNTGASGTKRVLLEEFTTAPCQFCPDGAVVVENILATIPEAIAVGIHAGFGTDAMTIPAHVAYANAFAPGAPTATVDRVLFDGESDVAISRGANGWVNAVNAQKAAATPVNISLSGVVNSATSVDLTVDVNFVDYAIEAQDLRVTVFVVEDNVTGAGSGYNQVNFYNNQAGHPYFGAGNPIIGFNHKHVVRDVPSGTWGDAAYFTSTPTLNANFSKTYSLNLSSTWKSNDVSFVAFVNYYNPNGGLDEYIILNAEEVKLSTLVGEKENSLLEASLDVFPNPADDQASVVFELESNEEVSLTLLDITGKVINRQSYGLMSQGSQRIELNTANLSEGLYFVNLRVGDNQTVRKIAVK